jgi:tetratricopeptide (TPR) repeat protein
MKKVVVASLLVVAGMAWVAGPAEAQTQVNLGSNAQATSSGVQMSPAEYNAYNSAISQTTPQTMAPALEAYLTAYPQSAVKASVLQQLMQAYSQFDPTKSLDAADRLLQVDPNNISALTTETFFHKQKADQTTNDPTAKQAELDKAADYAKKGLAASKPADMSDADFSKLKSGTSPIFYSAIGIAALNKKDTASAIDAYKKELEIVPAAATQTPGSVLQDIYFLAVAYLQSTPPDLINCAFYAARVAAYAPDNLKPQYEPTAKYCYKKYHGADDGYDAVVTAAKANLNPPAGFSIKPAPSPAEVIHGIIASTSDLGTLNVSDKELIFAQGSPEDAAKVWDTMKGKSVQIPDALVIESSPTVLKVAVEDGAVQSKTADFTFNMTPPDEGKTPVQVAAAKKLAADTAAATAVGQKVTLTGTYASYTPNPIMITMSDGAVILKKAAKPTPVHHATPHK